MSRPAAVVAPSADPQVDWAALASGQAACKHMHELVASSSLTVQQIGVEGPKCGVTCLQVFCGLWCPLNSSRQFSTMCMTWHTYLGIRASQRLISSRFMWRGCTAKWCIDCQHCACGKVMEQETTVVENIQIPDANFWHIHMDLVGPLPTSKDCCSYLLTAIDSATRWPEAFPLHAIIPTECVEALTAGWVARYGVPHTLTTDQSNPFTGMVWKSMCAMLSVVEPEPEPAH